MWWTFSYTASIICYYIILHITSDRLICTSPLFNFVFCKTLISLPLFKLHHIWFCHCITLLANDWPIQLWRLCVWRTHPVGCERSSVGHQVSDFVILTFPGRLQQTLPQVHQWHLHQHTHWKPLLSQNQPGNSTIKWPRQPHDDDVSSCIPTLSVWNLQYLFRPVRWNWVIYLASSQCIPMGKQTSAWKTLLCVTQ